MAELEKQNLENRLLILGVNKPNQFFNTHQRVYEKVQINMNSQVATAPEKPSTMSRLYENSLNNSNLVQSVIITSKAKSNPGGQYTSISSNDNGSNHEPSQRSLIEKKLSKNAYG
jgi:hypothetical protein